VTSKIKLTYLLCATSMGFGGASVHASDDSKISAEQHGKYEICFAHLKNLRGNESYKKCLKDNIVGEIKAKKFK